MVFRQDQKLTAEILYNTLLETGGVLISDEIEIVVDLEINPV